MRSLWINIHLYLAAFFAPMLLVMAISGGGYLLGQKGSIEQTSIELDAPAQLSLGSESIEDDVRNLLVANAIEHEFEYLKILGQTIYTRPTSRTHYEFQLSGDQTNILRNEPDLQKRLVELHKGHGPLLFKDLQKIMALGLVIVLLSGLWLGLSSPTLRLASLIVTSLGTLVFFAVAFLL